MNANMDKSTNNSVSNVYTILTEEVPEQNEIKFIIQNILNIDIDMYNTIDILPVIHNEKFTGEWCIIIDTSHIIIRLFNGLCITIDSIENVCKYQHLEYPVVFALDTNGVYFSNL